MAAESSEVRKKVTPSRFHFRAWDRVEERMIPDVQDNLSYTEHIDDDPASISVSAPRSSIGFLADHPDYVLMQSTGMRDIHGREVFEGDIVDGTHGSGFVIRFGEYSLTTEESEWQIIGFYHNLLVSSESGKTGIVIASHYDFAVIGNAYENPELLAKEEREDFGA